MNIDDYLTPVDKTVKVGDVILYSEASYVHVNEGQIINIDFPIIEIEFMVEPRSKQLLDVTKIEILRITARG